MTQAEKQAIIKEYAIKEGDTAKLKVIFDPVKDVNTNLTWTSTAPEAVFDTPKNGHIP